MGNKKMRAEFEEYFQRRGHDINWCSERSVYTDYVVQVAWLSWRDSRVALAVELPEKISQYNTDDTGLVSPAAAEHDEAIDDCRAAIEAAGVRVKP